MAEILWDGFKNQKLLAERAYKDEHGDNIAETYAKKTELDTKVDTSSFNSAIGVISSDIDDIHDWAQDTFVSGDELSDYYKKSETSGASELAAEFGKYQPAGDYVTTDELDDTLENYAQEDELTGYYTTANPSGFLNAVSAEAAGFATETWVEEQDYALSSDVAAELDKKLDTAVAESTYYPKTNPAGYISEIPSEYITETELSTELSNYTNTAELESMLEGKQDVSGMTGYYPSTNPSGFLNADSAKTAGFATETWVEEKNYALSSDVSGELSKKLDSDTAEATYYPLNENPAGYLTNADLESYATKSELEALDTKVGGVSGDLASLNDTVTGLSETVEGIDDTVERVVSDIGNIDGELDTYGENIAFISGAVDFVSANVPSVAGYALSADVDTRLGDKQDVTAMSAYAQKTWVDSEYVSETELETALTGYYTKDETSGASELATEFGKYQPAGDYVTTASLESTLGDYATTGWAESTFLTAVPPGYALSADVDTRLADKLDEDTADSKYYPLNEKPSGYLTAQPSLAGYALSADVDTRLAGKVDKVEGKGLSTNDYTTVDKNRLDEAWGVAHTHSNKSILDNVTAPYTTEEKTKLAGIEASAQVNVQSDWEQSDSAADDFIKNKPTELSIAAGEGIGITEANNTLTISVSADYATDDNINFLSGAIDGKVATTAFNDVLDDIEETFGKVDMDIDYLSGAIENLPGAVQSDWTEDDTSSPAYIQNKPTSLSMSAGEGIDITESNDTLTFSVSGDYATNTALAGKIDKVTSATSGNVTMFGANGTIEDSKFAANHLVNLKIKDSNSHTGLANYIFLDSRENLLIAGNSGNNVIAEDVEGYLLTEDEKKSIPAAASVNNQLVTTTAMAAAIADFGGFDVVSVDATGYPDVGAPDTKTIYLTKDSTVPGDDKYKQWIWEAGDSTAVPAVPSAWELIGDTSMNLDGYIQCPAAYTAGHIVQFTANSAISDTGYTVSDLQNVQADWNETVTAADSYIQNKPTFTTAAAGTDGVSVSMAGTTFTALTAHQTIPQQVQADWNETVTANASYIQNKPDILLPVSSGGFAAPTKIVVVSAMPASPDPTTIYLVKEAT